VPVHTDAYVSTALALRTVRLAVKPKLAVDPIDVLAEGPDALAG
jgi:hypothetical protein